MVKGITRRVVVIKSPDPRVFDEAIFIVKEDATKNTGVTTQEILRQAQSAAESYVRSSKEKRRLHLPPSFYALFGAGATGAVWLLSELIH